MILNTAASVVEDLDNYHLGYTFSEKDLPSAIELKIEVIEAALCILRKQLEKYHTPCLKYC